MSGMTRLYLRTMEAERKHGVIINIIGLGGERLDATYIAGAMGNAGLMAFTRAIGGTSLDPACASSASIPARC